MDLFHALNRGVDKRIIFQDNQDYARFVHDMYAFNTTEAASNTRRTKMFDLRSRTSDEVSHTEMRSGEQLVDIHGWCLMGNHYHLLLGARVEGGLSLFLRRLNVGYAKYFNERYKRSGTLFQGRTKKILIDTDAHLLHILNYVHLNPLDLLESAADWRGGVIGDSDAAINYLHSYKWSSFNDYAGKRNFPSVITTSFFNEVFSGDYFGQLTSYMNDISMESIRHLTLE